MNYSGKVVIITGAGRGIGRGIAQEYAKSGANVVLADRNDQDLQMLKEEIRTKGGNAITVLTDVREPGDIHRLMKESVDAFGRIDILINNAGISRFKSPYELTVDDWEDVIHTNLRSVFLCSREAALVMRKQSSGGAIVNIASTRALMSEPNSEAYAATKGGIVSLTHALAVSLGVDGIRVNAISPGWIETGDYSLLSDVDHGQHPVGRVGKPEDIARACLFLTAEDNSFITGENMVIDGGMTKKMIYEE
jgi:NAD(P)-dependent dehydrogenase (short-subunit alcohol dehydrogenase family)